MVSQIRALRPDEAIPSGEPRKYANDRGYIRLRWRVGVESYVEEYEHRVVMGRPEAEVHHINGDKQDNRPVNLIVLSKRDHALLHQREAAEAYAARRAARGGHRSVSAQLKADTALMRRRAIEARTKMMRADYEAGMTTTAIGEKYGIRSQNVSVHLRRAGTTMRPFSRWAR